MNRQRLDRLKQEKKDYTRAVLFTYLYGNLEQKEMVRWYIKQLDKEINFVEKHVLEGEFWDLNKVLTKMGLPTSALVNTFLLENRLDLSELAALVTSIK